MEIQCNMGTLQLSTFGSKYFSREKNLGAVFSEKLPVVSSTWQKIYLEAYPVRIFFEIRRYFSKIALNSSDTAVNLPRNTDAPFS